MADLQPGIIRVVAPAPRSVTEELGVFGQKVAVVGMMLVAVGSAIAFVTGRLDRRDDHAERQPATPPQKGTEPVRPTSNSVERELANLRARVEALDREIRAEHEILDLRAMLPSRREDTPPRPPAQAGGTTACQLKIENRALKQRLASAERQASRLAATAARIGAENLRIKKQTATAVSDLEKAVADLERSLAHDTVTEAVR